ncbi:MAG: sigma-70 family RNA polymerase sigma factor [Planctomycetia bacterium]|nr:sigma-70 family RNA polymerase sigma factor [Planctomycetia bacterium]
MTASPDNDWPPRQASDFASTQWSLVLRAGQRGNQQAEFALASLCQRYWFPLYAYVRRRVADVHRAQDLTQDFFARLLEKNVLASASPERGRFRSFLLASLKNFLANEWDRLATQKRGGDRRCLSLDWDSGESRLSLEPVHFHTPEREFERQWALSLLEIVVRRLHDEFAASEKLRQFELLKETLTGDRSSFDYLAIATEMQISEDAARQAAHRLRKRYRELLREEVAATVESDNEIEDEIGRLFEAFGG